MITGGVANSRLIKFNLHSPITAGIERFLSLVEDLKKALGVESIRLNRHNGQLQLQIVRPNDPAVPLVDLMSRISDHPSTSAILGFGEDGSIIRHDFAMDSTPNIFISGGQNAGKTILLRTIAASLALTNKQADVQLVVINPISVDSQRRNSQAAVWRPLNYIPHMLTDVISRQTDITEGLLFLVREMNYRNEHFFATPRIIVLIDQAATLMERGGRTIVESISRIAERGADAGIHLVLSTRRPHSDYFSPHLLANLQSRFIGSGIQGALNPVDEKTTERESSLLGEGDFLTGGLSKSIRFQAAYIDDYDLHMGLSKLYQIRPILLAQPMSTRMELNPANQLSQPKKQFTFTDGLVAIS